ncbi:MAG: winged helix-turn-helix domain-containing protein [Conexivisphaerales archaeon]
METARQILLFLTQKDKRNQKEISDFVSLSPATVNWHMKRLENMGLVIAKHEGRNVWYLLNVDRSIILALLKTYHPAIWERWADRLAELLGDLSQGFRGESEYSEK